jgi:hypothetical protein
MKSPQNRITDNKNMGGFENHFMVINQRENRINC